MKSLLRVFEGRFVFFLCLFHSSVCATYADVELVVGNAVSINGRVRRSDEPLSLGAAIYKDDIILVAKDSSAKFLMSDRSLVDLGSSTEFKVNDYKQEGNGVLQADLQINFGRIRALVQKKVKKEGFFRIRTKASVLAVKGTEFVVISEPVGGTNEVQVTVIEGSISVESEALKMGEKPLTLFMGSQWTHAVEIGGQVKDRETASMEPWVERLTPQQLESVALENRIQDETFNQVITVKDSLESEAPSSGSQVLIDVVKMSAPEHAAPPELPKGETIVPGSPNSLLDLISSTIKQENEVSSSAFAIKFTPKQ